MSRNPVVGKVVDLAVALFGKIAEKQFNEFSFDDILHIARTLRQNCTGEVYGYKCFVVRDGKRSSYQIGVFPVDGMMNTFGGEDVVMDVVRAKGIDEKLSELIGNKGTGQFFLPEN